MATRYPDHHAGSRSIASTFVILPRASAANDATYEDSANFRDEVEPRVQFVLAEIDFGGAATTAAESSAPLASSRLQHPARDHRSFSLGEIFFAAIQATGAIARRAHARYRQRRQARANYDALRQLDDRTLRDLGFDRSEIMSIAVNGRREADRSWLHAMPASHGLPK